MDAKGVCRTAWCWLKYQVTFVKLEWCCLIRVGLFIASSVYLKQWGVRGRGFFSVTKILLHETTCSNVNFVWRMAWNNSDVNFSWTIVCNISILLRCGCSDVGFSLQSCLPRGDGDIRIKRFFSGCDVDSSVERLFVVTVMQFVRQVFDVDFSFDRVGCNNNDFDIHVKQCIHKDTEFRLMGLFTVTTTLF